MPPVADLVMRLHVCHMKEMFQETKIRKWKEGKEVDEGAKPWSQTVLPTPAPWALAKGCSQETPSPRPFLCAAQDQ